MVRLFGRSKRGENPAIDEQLKPDQTQTSKPYLTVTQTAVDRARRELKLLEVERDVAQYALTRIFEAEAGGLITEEERDSLAERYKSQMKTVEERMGREQMLVELRELELGQSELVRIFNEKFGELDKRIQGARTKLGYTSTAQDLKTEATPIPEPDTHPSTKKKPRVVRQAREEPPKTKVEIEIERLQEEVRKALEKLEQIELEG